MIQYDRKRRNRRLQTTGRKGQSLVEFALVIPILILTLLTIIETARAFHAYISVQHAAQEAARFAATGRCDPGFANCAAGITGTLDSIRTVSENSAKTFGLSIDEAATTKSEAGYYFTRVIGSDRSGNIYEGVDRPGDPGAKTFVTVTYTMPVISPLISSIVPTITLSAESVVTNETQGGSLGQEGVLPPPLDLDDFQETVDDGVDDDWEFDNFGSPGKYDDEDDPDGDGCDNMCEYSYPHDSDPPPNELDPNNPDTDSDGMPDGWEIDNGLNPLVDDGGDDLDGDGTSNLDEYLNETDPQNPNDFPGALNVVLTIDPTFAQLGESAPLAVDVVLTDHLGDPVVGLLSDSFTWTMDPDPGITMPVLVSVDNGTGTYHFELYVAAYPEDTFLLEVLVDDGDSTETASSAFQISSSSDLLTITTFVVSPSSVQVGTVSTVDIDIHVIEEGLIPKTGLLESNFTWTLLPAGTTPGGFFEDGNGDYSFTLSGVETLGVDPAHALDVTVDDGAANTSASTSFAVTAAPDELYATLTIAPDSAEHGDTSPLLLGVYVEEEGAAPKTTLVEGDFGWTPPTGAGIVGGSFTNNGDGNYYFALNIAGVAEGTGYTVSVVVNDGSASANASDTFDITPASVTCQITPDANFTYSDSSVYWAMTNTGVEDLVVRRATVTWPDGDLNRLYRIYWRPNPSANMQTIWEGGWSDGHNSPTDFGDGTSYGWDSSPRSFDIGDTGTFRARWYNENSVRTPGFTYGILVEFELASDPGTTACSVYDSHTFSW